VDELYVLARRVLLDALDALGPHRPAVVLVGAQAIYLRVAESDLAVQPYTTDGDLAIDPSILADTPPLEDALTSAGFSLQGDAVGIWVTPRTNEAGEAVDVMVDLLVPASASPGKGRRAARLPGHDSKAARIVTGLEGALIDADVIRIGSLEPSDHRQISIRVAGPAALLVAKMHKISDRTGTGRTSDKDALDVLRLLQGVPTADLAARLCRLLDDPRSRSVAEKAVELLQRDFGTPAGVGIEMVIRSAGPLADPEEIRLSLRILVTDLLASIAGPQFT